MNFKDADKVSSVVFKMRDIDALLRSPNRADVNALFNGNPPFTPTEEKEENIQFNIGFPEGTVLLANARHQWNNAFLKPGNYFSVKLDSGPKHKRGNWSHWLQRRTNRPLKRSMRYTQLKQGEGAQCILHGIGPSWWPDASNPIPKLIGVEDLLIPSSTDLDFSNLAHFAIFQAYTQSQLKEFADTEHNAGWNQKWIKSILEQLNPEQQSQNTESNPEKLEDQMKSNGGFWESDAVPVVKTWTFFFRDGDSWRKRIILDDGDGKIPAQDLSGQFLFENNRDYGPLSSILHCQFMDGSNKAPFKYHTVRGLGFLLYGVCHIQNRYRCRFTERAFQDLVMLFRNVNKEDSERLTSATLYDRGMGIIPEGLSLVPGNERYQMNMPLAEALMAQNRQMMSEASASFVQDIDNSSDRETATLTNAKMQTVSAMVGAMLNLAYEYAGHQYREICRRMVKEKEFIDDALREGIPQEMLNTECWDIDSERVIGSGNKILEVGLAKELMAIRPLLAPEAQQMVTHTYVLAISDDSAMADQLVPLDQKPVSNAITFAEQSWATIMEGLPITPRPEFNHIEIAETWLKFMAATVQRLMQSGGMGTLKEIMGLQNAAQHIDQEIKFIAQDENEKQRVKQYSDILGKLMNEVKGMMQRMQEAMQKQQQQQGGQIPPEAKAKIVASGITAQSQAKIKEASAQQKMKHKEQSFALDQRRREQEHGLEMRRKIQDATIDAHATDLKTAADIASTVKKNENEGNKD